jgi:hypothetical protein
MECQQDEAAGSQMQTEVYRDTHTRPAHKLTVGLIETYKNINKVSAL